MSKEKQFEEMAKIAKQALDENRDWRCKCDICVANIIDGIYCDESAVINGLYNAGYRKQSEGEWELHGNDDDLGSSFFCSRCGWNIDEDEFYRSQTNDYKMYKFCPNCGAKMKGA